MLNHLPPIAHIHHILQTTVQNPHTLSTFSVYKTKQFLLHEHPYNTTHIYFNFLPRSHSPTTTYYALTTLLPTTTNSNITAENFALRIFNFFLKVCAFPRNTRQFTISLSLVLWPTYTIYLKLYHDPLYNQSYSAGSRSPTPSAGFTNNHHLLSTSSACSLKSTVTFHDRIIHYDLLTSLSYYLTIRSLVYLMHPSSCSLHLSTPWMTSVH